MLLLRALVICSEVSRILRFCLDLISLPEPRYLNTGQSLRFDAAQIYTYISGYLRHLELSIWWLLTRLIGKSAALLLCRHHRPRARWDAFSPRRRRRKGRRGKEKERPINLARRRVADSNRCCLGFCYLQGLKLGQKNRARYLPDLEIFKFFEDQRAAKE